MPTTPVYGLPYQGADDGPNGPDLGQNLAEAVEGQLKRLDVGYRYLQTVVFTAGGTFSKASYPQARFARIECQGSGGAGGGTPATAAGQTAAGSGGSGGDWATAWVAMSALATNVTVTVPSGPNGTSGGSGNNGAAASFGTHCVAPGGLGGLALGAANTPGAANGTAASGTTPTGEWFVKGQGGGPAFRGGATGAMSGQGGSSRMGGGGRGNGVVTGSNTGVAGGLYGGGGSGAVAGPSTAAQAGAAGAQGLVLVHLYA